MIAFALACGVLLGSVLTVTVLWLVYWMAQKLNLIEVSEVSEVSEEDPFESEGHGASRRQTVSRR